MAYETETLKVLDDIAALLHRIADAIEREHAHAWKDGYQFDHDNRWFRECIYCSERWYPKCVEAGK